MIIKAKVLKEALTRCGYYVGCIGCDVDKEHGVESGCKDHDEKIIELAKELVMVEEGFGPEVLGSERKRNDEGINLELTGPPKPPDARKVKDSLF